MLLKANNFSLVEDVQKTYLTAAVAAAGTTLTVKDNTGISNGDYLILGEIGEEGTEIKAVNGAVTAGTSITITAVTFAHGVDTPIYRADFNQCEFSRATTLTGSKSVLNTGSITPDQQFTIYDDTTNTTGYGFVRWKNSTDASYSSYSAGVNYEHTGDYSSYDPRTLYRMRKNVRVLLDEDRTDSKLSDEQIKDALNNKQRDVGHQRFWSFYEVEKSLSSVDDQFAYDIPDTVQKIYSVIFDTQPLIPINYYKWKTLHWDTDQATTDPYQVCVWNNQLLIHPRPSASASTTAIDDADDITAIDTTITVDATSSFNRGDYYRFIIDSEVIYATGATATTFTGCLRGQEGTTAATHADNAVVTERDIVYTGHEEPVDLFDITDRTQVPEPEVLEYGASADLALYLEKEERHDRLLTKYKLALKSLESKYSTKISSQFGRVKDSSEVLSDLSGRLNANLYPKNLTSS